MYHPGKVLEVFSHRNKRIKSAEATTQAMCEMWDENVLTFLVDPKIADDMKEGDVVLVDYRPTAPQTPIPKHVIVKILSGEQAQRVWKRYKQHYERRKKLKVTMPRPIAVERRYIG
jgi:hypothetical protein